MLNKTHSLRPHCVSCWTTYILQDDIQTIQCQDILEALRLLRPEAVKLTSGGSERETWESVQLKFVNVLIPNLNLSHFQFYSHV